MKRTPQREERVLKELELGLTPRYLPPYCTRDHDVSHVQRMCNIGNHIWDSSCSLFLLEVTIWLHNLDRSTFWNWEETTIEDVVREILLPYTDDLERKELALLLDAVLHHAKLNDPGDSRLLVHLKDCDRLDMGAVGVWRICISGSSSPLFLPEDLQLINDPNAGVLLIHRGEERRSVVADVLFCLDWQAMLRLPKAKELGKRRFGFLRLFLEEVQRELGELGLL